MKKLSMQALLTAASLTVANFGYQAFTGHKWETAFERSVFQYIALFAYWRGL